MANDFKLISVQEVLDKQASDPNLLLLDVRTEEEWEMHHIPGATLLPMHLILERINELDSARETIVICEHGIRSRNVAEYLASQAGFDDVSSMEGGMSEWTGPKTYGA